MTVQLPVCDDTGLAASALAAIACIDYPHDRLDVQVCDDSTTPAARHACRRLVETHRAAGLDVAYVRRPDRRGFKAGNLLYALTSARGEFIALVDADVLVRPDFLRRLVPCFTQAPRLAAVQGTLTHRNASANALTRAIQSLYDVHLRVEQPARSAHGLWMEFMGSGGVWRRAAIDACGGWPTDTGTEDVHLSLLAQTDGWTIRFSCNTTSSALVPEETGAFRRQQTRWARSMGVLARRLGPTMLRADAPLAARLEGFAHVTGYLVHVAMVATMLLAWPVVRLAATGRLPPWYPWVAAGLLAASVALGSPATAAAARRVGPESGGATRVGLRLAWINAGTSMLVARAYLAGLLGVARHTWHPSGAPPPRAMPGLVDPFLEALAVTSVCGAAVEAWRGGVLAVAAPAMLFGACTLLFLTAPVWLPLTARRPTS